MGSTIQKSSVKVLPKIDFRLVHDVANNRQRLQWNWLKVGMILLDALMITAGFVVAYVIRFRMNIPFFYSGEESLPLSFYIRLAVVLIPLWILIYAFAGLYSRQNILGGTREYSLLFNATTIGIFMVISANFLVPQFILARGWLLLTWIFAFFLAASGRFLLRRLVYALRAQGLFVTQALIVGANEESRLLAGQFQNQRASGLHVVGFIADDVPVGTEVIRNTPVLGGLDQLLSLSRDKNVEEIIVTSSAVSSDDIIQIFKLYGIAEGVNLHLSSGLYEIITTGLQVHELAAVPLVKVNKIRLTGIDQVLKTLMDYGLSIPVLLLVVIPLSVIFGILIKIDSKGPVFHRRRVMGMNGRSFDAFKFRTMVVNGDEILDAHPELKEELAREHKLKEDPRITRVGRLLRKASLDELPQVFNVLRGEMSLVGPRMISPEEMEKYQQLGMNLLTVKPGITGLWQVSGRSDVSYEQRVRIDMYYIRNWSIWLDVQVILRTIPAILSHRGAY